MSAEIKLFLSPITTTCSIYGDVISELSNGAGATFLPPEVTKIFFFLSVIFRNP